MTELQDSMRLASKVLDEPGADPDSDKAMLSRQLLRSLERETVMRGMIDNMAELLMGILTNLPPDMQELPTVQRAQAIVSRIIEHSAAPQAPAQGGG